MPDKFPPLRPERPIDVEFFRKYGVDLCEKSFQEWQQFLRDHRPRNYGQYLKCLAICANVGVPLVKVWLSKQATQYTRVAREHVAVFQVATLALGLPLPRDLLRDRPDYGSTSSLPKKRGPTLVALFVSFEVVSEPYHLAVIRGLVDHAAKSNVMLSVHDLPWSHPVSDIDAKRAGFIVTKFAPDAIILMRLTPSRRFLDQMVFDLKKLPVVLIHADRQVYPHPVLANIVPDHSSLAKELRDHVKSILRANKRRKPTAVLVAMHEETEANERFAPLDGAVRSIRNERIAFIKAALGGFVIVQAKVPDYSFRHAHRVLQEHPDADLYLCLSDQLAVSLKQLMLSRGVCEEDCYRRIVGFDGSSLAAEERISSLSQGLMEVGQRAIQCLCEFFSRGDMAKQAPESYRSVEIPIPVKLLDNRHIDEQ